MLRGRLALSPAGHLCHEGNAGACCRFLYSAGCGAAPVGGRFFRAALPVPREVDHQMLPLTLEFLYKVPVSFWL
jgi:hypothetical protein